MGDRNTRIHGRSPTSEGVASISAITPVEVSEDRPQSNEMAHVTRVSVGFDLPDPGEDESQELVSDEPDRGNENGAADAPNKWGSAIAGATPEHEDPQGYFQNTDQGNGPNGGLELANLVVNPGLKKWESTELLNTSIHQAARDGDAHQMEKICNSLGHGQRRKINKHDENKLSALHYAARYNNYETARVLLEKKGEVDNRGEDDATPLHFAARYKRIRIKKSQSENKLDDGGSADELSPSDDNADGVSMAGDVAEGNNIFSLLVQFGADINARDAYGCCPLHFAAMRGNEIAARELLSFKHIKIEAVDKQYTTPLHMAANHNQVDVAKMLINAGANLRCADEENSTPLHMAASEGSLKIVKMLFAAAEKKDGWVTISQMVSDQDADNCTALHLAVDNGHYEVAKLLIEKNADVNTVKNGHSTPLHLAAISGDVRTVKLLIDSNARIDALNDNMATPLHRAASYNHADVVEFLLEKGAKMERRDKDGFTPLLLAACYGHANTIKSLLKKGADMMAVDKNDKTAIYWCAEENKTEAMIVLLNNPKATYIIDESDRYGYAPLHMAAECGYLACLKMLIEKGADMDIKDEEERTPLHVAANKGRTNIVRELVAQNKTIVNDEDEDSNTALHLAALEGHVKVAAVLIDGGANIEARNTQLWTPLDCAASKGWEKVCKVLLENDAPVDPTDRGKTTPLHLASERGHPEVVNLLMKWDADVSLLNTENLNCLDLAIDNNNTEVAEVIVKSKHWEKALRTSRLDISSGLKTTPMRQLIRKMPDVAEIVFNNCTTANKYNPDHPNYEITFNYEFLDDMYSLQSWIQNFGASESRSTSSEGVYGEDFHLNAEATAYTQDSSTLKKNHPLMIMVNSNREDLLAHPLVTSLLRHKWNHYGRYVYYVNLFLYAIFLTFLTGFMLVSVQPYHCFGPNNDKDAYTCTRNGSNLYDATGKLLADMDSLTHLVMIDIGQYIAMGLCVWNLLKELFQLVKGRLAYFGWENLMEWILYVFALILLIPFDNSRDVKLNWQWQIGVISLFLAWMNLVLFIRKFPRFGIYVVMFTEILKTFMQFFIVFFLFIIAFALSFHLLFSNQASFRLPATSLLKTTIMMIGEFEYDNIFTDSTLHYPEASYILFVLFVAILTILVMNLLVGLAVDDIKGVQEKSALKRMAMQVELALYVEGALPGFIRRKFIVKCEKISPNKINSCFKMTFNWDSTLSSSSIAAALNPELDELEVLQENQEKMQDQISAIRFRLKGIRAQNEKIEGMLAAVLEKMEVNYDEEDEHEEEMNLQGTFLNF